MRKKRPAKAIAFDAAWRQFSLYVRLRDARCITCQKVVPYKEANAGHYIHKSRTSNLYFDEHNVHKQCVKCNLWNSGRLDIYSKRIIELYGIGEFNRLHRESAILKNWKVEELEIIKEKYKLKANHENQRA